jgi:hypothetical protein
MVASARAGSFALAILLSLGACGAPNPVCVDCEPLRIGLARMGEDGEPIAHPRGEPFPWSWGAQGGTMIVPTFTVDAEQLRDGDTVLLTLRHEPDPDHPEAFGAVADFPFQTTVETVWRTAGGRLVVGPVLDQLGWNDLDGVRLRLTAELRAEDGRVGALTETLAMVAEGTEDPACTAFATMGGGCTYRAFPGQATVTAITDPRPTEYACAGGRRVELSFAPDEADAAAACLASMGASLPTEPQRLTVYAGASPPVSCLEAAGVTVGSVYRAELWQIVRGGCAPSQFIVDVDLSACVCE